MTVFWAHWKEGCWSGKKNSVRKSPKAYLLSSWNQVWPVIIKEVMSRVNLSSLGVGGKQVLVSEKGPLLMWFFGQSTRARFALTRKRVLLAINRLWLLFPTYNGVRMSTCWVAKIRPHFLTYRMHRPSYWRSDLSIRSVGVISTSCSSQLPRNPGSLLHK